MLSPKFYDECDLQQLFQMLSCEMRNEIYESIMHSGEWCGNPLNKLISLWSTNIYFANDIHRYLNNCNKYNMREWEEILHFEREDIQYYLEMGSYPDLAHRLAVINHFYPDFTASE
jgi:hypothetical protein